MKTKLFTLGVIFLLSTNLAAQTSGTCGANLTWTLSNGVLTITGTGPMFDYNWHETPWFENGSSISSVVIDNGVTSIGGHAFDECSQLTSIFIPDSITSIGECAFKGCSSLTSIMGGNGLTSIGYCAFQHCSALTVVSIPDRVTSIGSFAFFYCTNLTTLSIPNSVTSIGCRAFGDCDSLSQVYVYSPVPITIIGQEDWGSLMIFYTNSSTGIAIPNNLTIYVPCASLDAYKSAMYWSAYASRMESLPLPSVICNVNDSARGYVDALIPQSECDSAVLTATPNYGYYFSKWSDNTTSNPYVLYATQDTTITAIFEKNSYTIQTLVNDASFGTTVGDTTAYYLDTVKITAIPNENYHFSSWSDDNKDNPRNVIVTDNCIFEAIFALDDTAIGNINSSSSLPKKVLENGQLVILLPDGARYNATGQLIK